VFTADANLTNEQSPLVKELHEWWGLGANPYEIRRREDAEALALLGAEVVEGGLLDSIYRTGYDGNPLYPTRQSVFSSPSREDPAWDEAKSILSVWMEAIRPNLVFCPMAVGRHVDHVVTTESFLRNVDRWPVEVYLYEDIPYSGGFFPPNFPDSVSAARNRSAWKINESTEVAVHFEAKFSAVLKYASQLGEIFAGLDAEQELRRYMSSSVDGYYLERFWRAQRPEERQG
jgi:LmbE family N-acetylglucosaminyl deacetylase